MELWAILEALGTDASTFLAKFGLSEKKYEQIRRGMVAQPDILTELKEKRTGKDINQWFIEDVFKRGRGRPPLLGDLDKLYSSITQTLANARHTAITYPDHPLTRNDQIVQPLDGYHTSMSFQFMESLNRSYFDEGPRVTLIDALSQKTWSVDIFKELARPIVERGGEKRALAEAILKHYEQMDTAFQAQMKRKIWQYVDIIPKSAVVKLVVTGELPRDSSIKYLGVNKLTETQVWDLVVDVVDRLEESETYHMALLDDISDPTDGRVQLLKQFITQHFWTAKPGMDGKLNLIMTEWPVNEQGTRWEVHYHVDDFDITKAFISIVGAFWRSMPADMLVTEKAEVVKFLNTQRRTLLRPSRK